MKLEICTHDTVFDALRDEWNPLLERSHNDLIFLTIEWQQTWWQAYSPGELYVVVGRTEAGDLAGIAPWFVDTQHGKRRLSMVGCVDVTDYLDIIADRDYLHPFLEALAEHLAENDSIADEVRLCNIPAGSPLLESWPGILSQHGFEVGIEHQEVCPVIDLPSTWDDYLAQLNKKQRHELRRKLRRAQSQADWYIVDDTHNLAEEITAFIELMAASNPEKAEFLEDPQHTAFFQAMIPRMKAAGWLQLNFLTIEDERAAAYLNFDRNNRIMVYNSGQDIEQFGALSAGIVLLAKNIRHAIDTEHTHFDFLRGNEPYKYQMGGIDTEVFQLTAVRA